MKNNLTYLLARTKGFLVRHLTGELSSTVNFRADELADKIALVQEELQKVADHRAIECAFFEKSEFFNKRLFCMDLELKAQGLVLRELLQTANLINRQIARNPLRIKCIFLVNAMHIWDALSGIYEAMLADDEFDPVIITIPGVHDEELAHRSLTHMGLDHIRLTMPGHEALAILKNLAPHVIFRQTPWDEELNPAFHAESLSFARLCYVPYYGLQVIERFGPEEAERDLHVDQNFHRSCLRIYCENAQVLQRYRANSVLGGANAATVGHPKLYRLSQLKKGEAYWPLGAEPGKARPFRVVWAPHHSISKDWMNFGAFTLMMWDMLAWAKEDPSVQIVLRPHPHLFRLIREGGDWVSPLTKEEFEYFLSQWESLPNTAIDSRGDYAKLFAGSDVMITCGVSFLTEYQIFGKPVIFFERDDHSPFNSLGEMIAEGTNRVKNMNQVRELVQLLRSGAANPRESQQRAVLEKIIPVRDPSLEVLRDIRNGIKSGLSAPSLKNGQIVQRVT